MLICFVEPIIAHLILWPVILRAQADVDYDAL